jgi:hypothetical protein
VAGDVELGDDANAAIAGEGDHLANLLLCVEVAVGTELLKLGIELALDAESLVVRQVPVEDVELDGGHRFEVSLDDVDGHPMAGDVDHETSPREARVVLDVDHGNREPLAGGSDQLREGGHAAQHSGGGRGFEASAGGTDIERVRLVLPKRGPERPRAEAGYREFAGRVVAGSASLARNERLEAGDSRVRAPAVDEAKTRPH